MKNFKGKLLMLVSILIPVFIFVGCSEDKKLTEEDVSFSFKKKENGKDIDLTIDVTNYEGKIDYTIYTKTEENEEEIKYTSGQIDGANKTVISVLDKKPETYNYKLVCSDEDGNTVEKNVQVIIEGNKEENEKDIKDEEIETSKSKDLEELWSGKGVEYRQGDKVSFEGKNFECLQAHKSQEDWSPKAAPSLFKEIEDL
ncbi:Chitinase [Clostridium baratii]|uniref:carbohydrate-binding protein n=1 Tax=Clostridium baratii TaxID=1561 RepID=UPI0006C46C16|nr:carbohydrate-binding protein [Clostridium baratii]CUP74684.1 Chitinase [Clostridium baratii]